MRKTCLFFPILSLHISLKCPGIGIPSLYQTEGMLNEESAKLGNLQIWGCWITLRVHKNRLFYLFCGGVKMPWFFFFPEVRKQKTNKKHPPKESKVRNQETKPGKENNMFAKQESQDGVYCLSPPTTKKHRKWSTTKLDSLSDVVPVSAMLRWLQHGWDCWQKLSVLGWSRFLTAPDFDG